MIGGNVAIGHPDGDKTGEITGLNIAILVDAPPWLHMESIDWVSSCCIMELDMSMENSELSSPCMHTL